MRPRTRAEKLALYAGLPLLLCVCLVTWRLWRHVAHLDLSLEEARKTEAALLGDVRDALGREQLAGRALDLALWERDRALDASDRARQEAREAHETARRQEQVAERLKRQRSAELDRMRDALARIASTDRTAMGMVVELGSDAFLFAFDSAELSPANREILSRIAGVLLASYGYRVSVFGHTDDRGSVAYNQELSERRAQAVRDYLAIAGVPAEVLSAEGYGKSSPRVDGTSADARRRNRRVEIGIVDTVIEYRREVPSDQP